MLELQSVELVHNAGSATEVHALRGVTVSIAPSQFVTVIGSNGAGKSSLVKIISGAHRATRGRVVLEGSDVTRQRQHVRARAVAHVFDNPLMGTAATMSIQENMALAMMRGHRRGLRRAVTRTRKEVMRDQLATLGLGLENRLNEQVASLSAGQRQSLTMLMAGLTKPKVLLLDEHLAALDPGTGQKVLDQTVSLARRIGCVTVMVTHNMQQAIDVGDRLLVMSGGQLIEDLAADAKRQLTVPHLVERIVRSQDTVSDRMLLDPIAPPATVS